MMRHSFKGCFSQIVQRLLPGKEQTPGQISKFYKIALTTAGTLAIAGCTQQLVAGRSIAYNKAVETTNNQQILLNAVRASKRYPMHFTGISSVTGSSPISGEIGVDIPVIGAAKSSFVASPSISLSSGTSHELAVLNTQDFYQAILSPIDVDTVVNYTRRGWPLEVLTYLFVQDVGINKEYFTGEIFDSLRTFCNNQDFAKKNRICTKIDERFSQIKSECEESIRDKIILADNDPSKSCFTGVYEVFKSLDLKVKSKIDDSNGVKSIKTITEIGKKTKEETVTEPKKETILVLEFMNFNQSPEKCNIGKIELDNCERKEFPFSTSPDNPGFLSADDPTETNETKENTDGEEDKKSEILTIELRSPQGMIFYLGEIIDAHESKKNTRDILIDNGFCRPHDLFSVEKGQGVDGPVSISFESERYTIPHNAKCRNDGNNPSMQTLALITQIFNSRQSRKDLPIGGTLRLVGGS